MGRVACSKRESFFGGGREGRWNGGKARGGHYSYSGAGSILTTKHCWASSDFLSSNIPRPPSCFQNRLTWLRAVWTAKLCTSAVCTCIFFLGLWLSLIIRPDLLTDFPVYPWRAHVPRCQGAQVLRFSGAQALIKRAPKQPAWDSSNRQRRVVGKVRHQLFCEGLPLKTAQMFPFNWWKQDRWNKSKVKFTIVA